MEAAARFAGLFPPWAVRLVDEAGRFTACFMEDPAATAWGNSWEAVLTTRAPVDTFSGRSGVKSLSRKKSSAGALFFLFDKRAAAPITAAPIKISTIGIFVFND